MQEGNPATTEGSLRRLSQARHVFKRVQGWYSGAIGVRSVTNEKKSVSKIYSLGRDLTMELFPGHAYGSTQEY